VDFVVSPGTIDSIIYLATLKGMDRQAAEAKAES
jgi:ABC-type uncharacterized transport system ATPase subunit